MKAQKPEEKLFILDLLKLNKSIKIDDKVFYPEESVINIIKQVLNKPAEPAKGLTDEEIEKMANAYLMKVGHVSKMDIIRHDYIQGLKDARSLMQGGLRKGKPKIICICGSTRFAEIHAITRWEFEKDGKAICLMINYLPEWYAIEQKWNGYDHYGEIAGNKDILDELHFRKIDLADEVFVINKNGYIGKSTQKEIEYATKLGKPIKYLEPID